MVVVAVAAVAASLAAVAAVVTESAVVATVVESVALAQLLALTVAVALAVALLAPNPQLFRRALLAPPPRCTALLVPRPLSALFSSCQYTKHSKISKEILE